MDCSTPGFPVHHQLPELARIHVYQVSDAIQQSYPLSSPSLPAFNLPQHQVLFHLVSYSLAKSIGASASASVLPMNIQDWFPLGVTGWMCLQSKWLPRVFSNTTVEKHQFFGAQLSLWFNSHIHTWPLEKPQLMTVGKVMSLLFTMLSRFVIVFLCHIQVLFFQGAGIF